MEGLWNVVFGCKKRMSSDGMWLSEVVPVSIPEMQFIVCLCTAIGVGFEIGGLVSIFRFAHHFREG